MNDKPETARLDIWLWRARFFKTRKLAYEFITKRGVRITRNNQTRKVKKPSVTITPTDRLAWVVDGEIRSLEILDLGQRRGPALEAQQLYANIELDGLPKAS